MTQTTAIFGRPRTSFEAVGDQGNSSIHIDRILERLSCLERPRNEQHIVIYLSNAIVIRKSNIMNVDRMKKTIWRKAEPIFCHR